MSNNSRTMNNTQSVSIVTVLVGSHHMACTHAPTAQLTLAGFCDDKERFQPQPAFTEIEKVNHPFPAGPSTVYATLKDKAP